jgi:acetylornithine deacetylase/succinyl-diaminopimelate desuccinylase-like protein
VPEPALDVTYVFYAGEEVASEHNGLAHLLRDRPELLAGDVAILGEPTEVRDIIVHMIEEYARHCGHADLVRECIDGRAGQ